MESLPGEHETVTKNNSLSAGYHHSTDSSSKKVEG